MSSKFAKIDKRSGYIKLIYLMWLVYAGFLNYIIWYINK
ncbi:tryptophan-rich sensory protein [Clostridioides difficile]|nr:tryptophan-rich sensory protein [Clostridioides difficile]